MLLQREAVDAPWYSFFTELQWVDQVGLVLVVIFTLLGIWRGMWWQIVRFLGVILSLALARGLSGELQPALQRMAGDRVSEAVTHGVSWFAIFLAGLVVAMLLGMLGKKTLEAMQLGFFDRLGGAVVGAMTGGVLHGALLILASAFTDDDWKERHLEGTRSGRAVAQVRQFEFGPLSAEAKEKIWGDRWQASE